MENQSPQVNVKRPFAPITHGPRVNTPTTSRQQSTSGKRKRPADFPTPPAARPGATHKQGKKSETNEDCVSSQEDVIPTPLRGHGREALDKGSTVIIFDWDDTLLSSTYLAGLGYRLDLTQEFPEDLQNQLNDLEEHVVLLLRTCIDAVGADRTVIITNAERGWVELSAKKFIPGVLPILEQCHIISARTTFEIDNTGPYEWKILAFYLKLQQSFGVRFPPPSIEPDCPYHPVLNQIYDHFVKRSLYPAGGLEEESDNSTEIMLQDDECEQSKHEWVTCPGGGVHQGESVTTDKPVTNNVAAPIPPKAMLLKDQDSYERNKKVSDQSCQQHSDQSYDYLNENGFLDHARQALSPWQLDHVGLRFLPNENYQKVLAEPKYIISFGDSLAEKHATQTVTRTLDNSVFKTIKFIERPNLLQVIKQLDLVLEHLTFFVECENPLDIVLALESF